MEKRERIIEIMEILNKKYSDVNGTVLNYENPIQLLVVTILSAQSTDEIVNRISSKLFQKCETAEDFVEIDREKLENLIYSSGYYRNKAKWIQECCKRLIQEYDSEVPQDIEELTNLPGVGRKTANVVLSEAFGINQGIAVDTHVMRLAKRLGFSEKEEREKIERDLMHLLPSKKWFEFSNLMIAHGRRFCEAKNPRCDGCGIVDLCSSSFSFD